MQFIRVGLEVAGKEVVSVVLNEIEGSLNYSPLEIRGAVSGKYGQSCQKDFL